MKPVLQAIAACMVLTASAGATGGQTPSDVRTGHWAGPAVVRTLKAGVLRPQSDGQFHGDGKVSRAEAAAALAALGRTLVAGTWKTSGRSRPVPDSVSSLWEKTNWKAEPVRRYAFATILARFGDYVANGAKRPQATAKTGQSIVLPAVPLTIAPSAPAYDALKYLAENRMIRPNSPLLKQNGSPLLGEDLSKALAELAAGINDKLTELGKESEGSDSGEKPKKKL